MFIIWGQGRADCCAGHALGVLSPWPPWYTYLSPPPPLIHILRVSMCPHGHAPLHSSAPPPCTRTSTLTHVHTPPLICPAAPPGPNVLRRDMAASSWVDASSSSSWYEYDQTTACDTTPTVAWVGTTLQYMFASISGVMMWSSSTSGATWGAWASLGAPAGATISTYPPSAVATSGGTDVSVFVCDSASGLVYSIGTTGGAWDASWAAYPSLDSAQLCASGVSAVSPDEGATLVDLLVIGDSGHLNQLSWTSGGLWAASWTDIDPGGGPSTAITTTPAAAYQLGGTTIEVFAFDSSGALKTRVYSGAVWGSWGSPGGFTALAAAPTPNNPLAPYTADIAYPLQSSASGFTYTLVNGTADVGQVETAAVSACGVLQTNANLAMFITQAQQVRARGGWGTGGVAAKYPAVYFAGIF